MNQLFSENRNTILAIVLSLVVLLGWQYFFIAPEQERQRAALEAQQQAAQLAPDAQNPQAPTPTPTTPGQANAPSAGAGATTGIATRDAALTASQRIVIDTPRLSGSINLTGDRKSVV